MAIARVSTRGNAVSSTSSNSLGFATTGAAIPVGAAFIVAVGSKNIATADGITNTHTGLNDGLGNVYTKLGEYTNAPSAAVEVGICQSLWLCNVTVQIPVGTTVTASFSANVIDKSIHGDEFSVGADKKLQQVGSSVNTEVTAATGFGSAVISGLPSAARLYYRAMSKEANSTTALTPTTNFTNIGLATRSRNNAAAVSMRGEFRINTSTGETSNPTFAVTGDTASVFVALAEINAYNLTATPGTTDITGTDAGVNVGYSLSAQSGALDIAGTNADLTKATGGVEIIDFVNYFNTDVSTPGQALRSSAGDPYIDRAIANSSETFTTGRVAFKVLGTDLYAGWGWLDGSFPTLGNIFRLAFDGTDYYVDAIGPSGFIIRTYIDPSTAVMEIELTATEAKYYVDGVLRGTDSRDSNIVTAYIVTDIRGAQNDKIYNAQVTALGPQAYSLTASAGAIAVSGTASGLNRGYLLTASAGTVSITGINATLKKGSAVIAQPGAVGVTGVNAGLNRSYTLVAQPAGAGTVGAIQFNGTGLTRNYGTLPAYGAITLAGWFRHEANDGTFEGPFTYGASSDNYVMMYGQAQPYPADILVQIKTGGLYWEASVRPINNGEWYYFALTFDGDLLTGFVIKSGETAVTKATISGHGSPVGSPTKVVIGNNDYNQLWGGSASQFRIWSAVLTDSEILAEMQSSSPVRTANLVSNYPLADATSMLTDTVNSGNNLSTEGTPVPTSTDGPPIGSVSVPVMGVNASLATGVAGYTLTTQVGAVPFTGTNAGVQKGFVVTAQSGASPISGVNAGLNHGYVVTAQPGIAPIAGVSAGLNHGYVLGASAGATPVTGVSATLNFALRLTASPGAVLFTGVDADLVYAPLQKVLTAQPGAVSLTGVDASLLHFIPSLIALPGAITLTGVGADLRHTFTLNAQPGAASITGVSATLTHLIELLAQSGVVAVTGVDADLFTTVLNVYNLTAQSGIINITDANADLRMTKLFTLLAGVVPTTGVNAVLWRSFRVTATSGVVPVLGVDAELIGVAPGSHSTDLIYVSLDNLHHHIGE